MSTIYDDMFCKFVSKDGLHYLCSVCGLRITMTNKEDQSPMFPCSKPLKRNTEQDNQVSFGQKIKNFAKSLIDHASAGFPTCTEEQIIERHNICMTCEFFKDDTCSKCGCPLTRNKQFLSKLAWSDQSCPVGKWGPIK
jgi:uncharacterized Zn finger protein (UPF0148 family)